MPEEEGNPKAEDFVSQVVKDAKQPPETLLLIGYLGASSEDGYTRLYFDPQLSTYVEIPDAAILHTQKIPAEQSNLGESYVWIEKNAEIIHGKVGPNRTKAKFLEGPIFQDFMRGAQFGGGAAPPQPIPRVTLGSPTCAPAMCVPPSVALPCLSHIPIMCPQTVPPACQQVTFPTGCPAPQCPPITLPFCPTETCPPSRLFPCPPISLPFCPTEACQPPFAQGGEAAMAQPVQPFAGVAPQQALPQTVLNCPTHPPFFCPQTVPPACPQVTFSFGCQTIAGCPPPWTPGSIACGWGQQPGGPMQGGGAGQG
jgi:hypothetical protein